METNKNLLSVLSFIAGVVLISGCGNHRINGEEDKTIQSETEPTSIAQSYSAFEGNYARLISKVTDNKDSLYIELIGSNYQKVDLIPINGEPNSYQVPNGRIVFSLSEDSQQIGLFHYRDDKKPSRKVFAQKINSSETNIGIQGEYIYQGCIIKEENQTLYTLRSSGDKLEKRKLFPISPTEFIVFGTDEKIEFVRGLDGKASKIISHNSKGSTTLHRAHVVNNRSKIGPKRFNGGWSGGGDLAMFWSHDPSVANESITRCIISIHGGSRNADGYYDYVQDLSISLGVNNNTMVLAPHFCETNDGQPTSVLHWTGDEDGDWRKGDNAANFGHVSNYEILDKLIESVVNNCPNLLNIIVLGHSAGGQVVTRFSAGTQIPEKLNLNTAGNPSIRFIVSNPSSYMYFSNKRWSGGTWPEGSFTTNKSACAEYNPSHYEAIHLNDYMSRDGLDLKYNVKKRNVIYLLGDQDTKDDPGLDKTCQAMLQGKHRLERGFIFLDHLREEFGAENITGHSISIVPGVGHNTWLMYRSYNGFKATFDYEYSMFRNNKNLVTTAKNP